VKKTVLIVLFGVSRIWAMQIYEESDGGSMLDVASMLAFGALLLLTPIVIASLSAWTVYPRDMKHFYLEELEEVEKMLKELEDEEVVSIEWNESALNTANELQKLKKELVEFK
jgi:uncharacterized BrkB/YihY/UPF0761 family membrane protein